MLWQIEGTETSLLATVHVSDVNPLWLPTEARRVVERSARIVFEHDLDGKPDLSLLMLPNGVRLGDVVSVSVLKAAATHWRQLGLPQKDMFAIMPGRVAMILTMTTADRAGLKAQYGVDRQLWDQAARDGSPREILEDLADVIHAMGIAPMAEQASALEETVGKRDLGLSDTRALLTAWTLGDVAHFERFLLDRGAKYPETMEAIIKRRNKSWLRSIIAIAESSIPTVVAVGALHLVGPHGIPALLKAGGFSVNFVANH